MRKLAVSIALILLVGCITPEKNRKKEVIKKPQSPRILMAEKKIANGDLLWPDRNQRVSLMRAIQFWKEGYQVLKDPAIGIKLAEAYFFAAFYYDQPELFQKGRQYSYKMLRFDPIIRKQIDDHRQIFSYISRVQPRHYSRLYWHVMNQLGALFLQKPYQIMLQKDDLIAQLNHLLRIDPKKRAILSFYGVLLIQLPKIAKGDREKGAALLKLAAAYQPDHLLPHYLKAIYYSGKTGAELKSDLKELIQRTWSNIPENRALIKKIRRNHGIVD